jgi:outer membrane lipoprotein carrier protein
MRILKISYFIFFLLGISLKSYAVSDVANLSDLLNSMRTMQANFTQTVTDKQKKSVQTSYGYMAIDRPGKFRWEIKKPIPQLIIANQAKILIYDPDLEQLTIRSLNQASAGTPALLLSHNNILINNEFEVKILFSAQNEIWFKLTPKQKDSMFEKIEMGFINKQIKEMRLSDHLGHMTSVKFTHAMMNQTLTSSLFNFKPPAHVDVVDETKKP